MTANQNPIPELIRKLEASDTASAVALLETTVTHHPQNPHVLLLLAGYYMQNKHVDQAEAAYIAALNLDPGLSIARFQLGLLQLTNARPATAFTTWAPLDLLSEKHPLRLFKQAFDQLQHDQVGTACAYLREGIQYNTDNPPLNRDMQILLVKLEAASKDGVANPSTNAETPASPAHEASAHFLVSTYKNLH
ncbi:tetratricopeptide repeat protein [Ralstonia sp. 22111]|uniref:tetratricopeptide repeat protein n=1 Tax=Ralstonia TaxID=48736 RepID=UPI003D973069